MKLQLTLLLLALILSKAQAYNKDFKAEGEPQEEKLRAYLQKAFGATSVDINEFVIPKESIKDTFNALLSGQRELVFTLNKDTQSAQIKCVYSANKPGKIVSIKKCGIASKTSRNQIDNFPKYDENKTYTYDYLDDLADDSEDEGFDRKYRALKARIGFSNYTCVGTVPSLNYSGSEKMGIVAAIDSEGFVIYSGRTGKSLSRFASGDGAKVQLFESDGSSREISFAAFGSTVNSMQGVRQKALSAGIYFREDIRRLSKMLKICCEEKVQCPAEPKGVAPTISAQEKFGASR